MEYYLSTRRQKGRIMIIHRLFDLLNSRNPHGKGFKAPMRKLDNALWTHVIDSSINYLAGLKDLNGKPLLCHRRKTFVLGMITTAGSVKKLAESLFNLKINPFSYLLTYLLTYKLGQD